VEKNKERKMSDKISSRCPEYDTVNDPVVIEDGVVSFSCSGCGAIYDGDIVLEEGDCLLINSIVDIFKDHDE